VRQRRHRAGPQLAIRKPQSQPNTLSVLVLPLSGKPKKLNTFKHSLSIIHLFKGGCAGKNRE
jgi:hypothetical protein